eukprot:scaffold8690_cov190-Amphora_coffeaeformis.AAC.1
MTPDFPRRARKNETSMKGSTQNQTSIGIGIAPRANNIIVEMVWGYNTVQYCTTVDSLFPSALPPENLKSATNEGGSQSRPRVRDGLPLLGSREDKAKQGLVPHITITIEKKEPDLFAV